MGRGVVPTLRADTWVCPYGSLIFNPAEFANVTNPGKDVLTLAQSKMVIGALARKLAMAKLMAMR